MFKDLKIDFQKLLQFGFVKEKEYYKYETTIMNNQFNLVIQIDSNNVIVSDCIEISTNEKLIPYYVSSSSGTFIGKIKNEYNKILQDIKEKCCSKNIFKNEYSNLIIDYVKNKYNDELEYLWTKFPNNAIWRNKENKKWYGALLIVQKSKLGIDEEGTMEIIDLLIEPERIDQLIDNKKYFEGYHMNKKHWITINLDGSVDINQIYEFIDNSYNLSKNK